MNNHLTDIQYFKKLEQLKQLDIANCGKTNYVKSFLEEQDRLAETEYKLEHPTIRKKRKKRKYNKADHELGIWLKEFHKKYDKKPVDIEKQPTDKLIINIIKKVLCSPFTAIYGFFEWYIEHMTFVKGIVLCAFTFSTIFCGWIAFLKTTTLICRLITTNTQLVVISPFESADYFPWMLLLVVWLLPFLIHFLGKYVIVFLPIVVIILVFVELILQDDFLTKAFFALIDHFMGKL